MTEIPTLTTERLTLRGPEPRDAEAFIAYFATERSQFTGGPMSRREAWRSFAVEIGHWQLLGFGMWTITEKGADTALGVVGLWYPEGWPEKELGWMLWPEAEGRGIAQEAALRARAHAFDTLGWTTAVSYIAPGNTRSIALAERLDAIHDDTAKYPGDTPCHVYRHPAPDALA